MLELRRLRLLRELHARGTIAAVADALNFTPSAVSQQLTILEREAGVPLLVRSGRGVRLTDAALVLVEHAEALLDRAARAEADLAQAAGTVAGRGRIAGFQSVLLRLALPATHELEHTAPRLRIELFEQEPEHALPLLALGDVDLVLGDEWQHQSVRLPPGIAREELLTDPVFLVLPAAHPLAQGPPTHPVPLARLRDDVWVSGHHGMGWEDLTHRACHDFAGFDPDLRHRTNNASVALSIVEDGAAVTLLPRLILPDPAPPTLAIRPIAEGRIERRIFVATRQTDAARPSTRAMLEAVRRAAEALRIDG